EGIRAARNPDAQQRSPADQGADHRTRLGHPLRQRQQRRRSPHQLAEEQDRQGVHARADPHRQRCRVLSDRQSLMKLTLRMRLAAISTIVFGVLLAGLSIVSYEVLGRRLDDDVTERLGELTAGLHGYLRFENDAATIAFDANDDDAAAFVHEATRY